MKLTHWPIGEEVPAHPRVLVRTASGSTYLLDADALTATRMLATDREIDVVGVPSALTDEGCAVHAGEVAAVRASLPRDGPLVAGLRRDGEPLRLAGLPEVSVGSRMVLAILGLVDAEHVTLRTTTPVVEIRVSPRSAPA